MGARDARLSGSLLSYESHLTRDHYRTLIAAGDAMHTALRGVAVDGLWPVEARVALFSPRVMTPYAHAGRRQTTCGPDPR